MIRTLKRFIKAEEGNLLFMTAGMALPLMAITGGVIEFSEISKVKTNIRTSAETAVIAAFRNPNESWAVREKRVVGFFKANLIKRNSLSKLNTTLRYHLNGKSTVITFTANGKIVSMLDGLSPFSAPNFAIQATAEYNPESKRAPYLVENTSVTTKVEKQTSYTKQ